MEPKNRVYPENSLSKLVQGNILNLLEETKIFPGHRRVTTIKHKITANPFFDPETRKRQGLHLILNLKKTLYRIKDGTAENKI